MYCKFLKLTSGENLIVSTEDDCVELVDKKYVEVSEPVEIHSMKMPYAGGVIEARRIDFKMATLGGGGILERKTLSIKNNDEKIKNPTLI